VRNFLIVACALALAAGAGCSSSSATGASPETRATNSVALYKQGVQEFNDGKVDEGIADLKKANELQPGYTLLRYDLARMLLHRGEENDLLSIRATEDGKRLAGTEKADEGRQKEDQAKQLYAKAIVDVREARDHLLWVADSWPHEPNVFYFLSKAYTSLAEFGAARKYLEKAIDLGQPTGPEREKLQQALERLKEAEIHQERLGKG
jgi:tetratricopeptide (TPR) repeat protein